MSAAHSEYTKAADAAAHFAAETPAFPVVAQCHDGVALDSGMTLRDYFAAKAMAFVVPPLSALQDGLDESLYLAAYTGCARVAYVIADAMLAARSA